LSNRHASNDSARISSASISMSKRAPKSLAIRLRRASQPSTPSSSVTTTLAAAALAAIAGTLGSPIRLTTSETSSARTVVI